MSIRGGRGAGSGTGGSVKAVVVDFGSGRTVSYRQGSGGTITDINKRDVKDTNGLTLQEIAQRAMQNGYQVTTYNSKQLKNYDAAYKEERKKANRDLDLDWYRAAPRPRKGMRGH